MRSSGQKAVQVGGRRLVLGLPFVFAANFHSRDSPKVISRVLPGAVDQQMLLFVDQARALVLGHFKIRRQLNRIRRASLLAEAAKDATRKVNSEEFRIAAAFLVLCRLERNAVHGTDNSAQVAGNATLPSVRIAREDDSRAVTWRDIRLLLRVLFSDAPPEGMQEHVPERP